MHTLGRALVALVALTAGGCVKLDSFTCAQSSECQNGDLLGTCEPAGLCSFPDPMCPSGKKYGELAGDQSGQCVGDGGGTSSSGTTSPTSSTTSVSATGSSTFEPTTDPGTTFEPTTGLTATSDVTTTTTDPSTTTTTATTDPVTTDPETTDGPTCGAVGDACVDGICCLPCTTCQDNVCQAGDLDVAKSKCGGACSACTADGQCGLQPADSPCTSNCSDLVWQQQGDLGKATCYAYADLPVDSVCDDSGQCVPPALETCPDPSLMPGSAKPLATCDNACLQGSDVCLQGKPASAVTPASFCALDVETAGCKSACTVDKLNVIPAICNSEGACVYSGMASCDPYFCDADTDKCFTKCMTEAECTTNKCQGMKCM